ncbi:Broad specificity phosphatase PhoE [Geosmithia morbida]|uniref:Broad specificity phosphatase PhoE n=1 Tax=Geosmithia morbida TaxID=1094350 RepID=A0A9P4YPY4_9HYPO|nr:Broad specificity phosphatase PhoE [Geosmithia morbida]KAF4119578.1 Broad specificity phosphatase PhoE [Geosmithia morbida]
MRLFLIRHGETVDNVASVYAGSLDSALTSHGVIQARLLASHLAEHAPADTHILSSDLQRAVKTAEAIRDSRRYCAGDDEGARQIQIVSLIREKDFGSDEGVRIGSRMPCGDSESVESMNERVDSFLDNHILPLCHRSSADHGVAVVAHGIILGVLFRRLRHRLPSGAVTSATTDIDLSLSPSWGNTGYLEATLSWSDSEQEASWSAMKLVIHRINSLGHLRGLRKTRGGIGSARFDSGQRTMDSFFAPKKRKLADAPSNRPVLKYYVWKNLSNRCLKSSLNQS